LPHFLEVGDEFSDLVIETGVEFRIAMAGQV
jgi:hypothetical protein